MHLANLTTATIKRISGLTLTLLVSAFSYAQDNSPYSRYGIGDLAPNQNMLNRGMGGVSAAYQDYQTINLSNPASLGSLVTTIFDLGGDIDVRSLKSNTSPDKFKSVNTFISYLQVAFPITPKKMLAKGNFWGVSFGLRPLTRVNYKIDKNERTSIDSLNTLYEGNGGISQANISTGVKLKKLFLGVSGGYSFGSKDYSTKLGFINDTVAYAQSNSETQTRFGGLFMTVGAQYAFRIKKKSLPGSALPRFGTLRIGAYSNLQQNLTAKRNDLNETFSYDANGGVVPVDTVTFTGNSRGTIKIPATYSFGFTYSDDEHWLFGADLDFANWETYSSYGQKDPSVQNNYTLRVGGQYYPATDKTVATKYWSFVKYRAGLYYGNDYISVDGSKKRPDFGATFGASFPLTSLQRNVYALQREGLVTLNAGLELGIRGNKQSQSVRENITRFSFGIAMNARWFQRVKYQ